MKALLDLLQDHKAGHGVGIYSVCSSHPIVIEAALREAQALVELRVPFELTRQAIDDVERGATDSDWSPLKEAARKIAFAEDRAVFDGYAAAGIQGLQIGRAHV